MTVQRALATVALMFLTSCGGATGTHPIAIPGGATSETLRKPLVFANLAKHRVYVYPSSTRYAAGVDGVTVVGTSGTKLLAGATLLASAGKSEMVRTPDAHTRGVRDYCANYSEQYSADGNVATFPYTTDYYTIVSVRQTEEADPMMFITMTQRDSQSLLYSFSASFQPTGGGQWELYLNPGVDVGYTVGGGAYITTNVQYGRPGDPYYDYEYGSATALVTC